MISKGAIPWNKGLKTSEETRLKQSLSKKKAGIIPPSRKGMSPTNAFKKGHVPWCKGKKTGVTPWNKGKTFLQITGPAHFRWKGGITPINKKIRKSLEYKLWRKAVFERDNYTCIWCENKGYVEADHIKPFSLYPELRFAIDNGRTLCHNCHQTTDTYGPKIKSYKSNG